MAPSLGRDPHAGKCPAYNKTGSKYGKQGPTKAACQLGVAVSATSNEDPKNKEVNLRTVEVLSNYWSFQVVRQGHNCQRCNHTMHKIKLQTDLASIPHMEHVMGMWQKTRQKTALCHDAYGEICLKERNRAGEKHTM